MSLLNKTNKENPCAPFANQLIELLEENILIDKCSNEDGILYIQNSDGLDNIYLSSDLLGLMAGKDSEIVKLVGIREVHFHKSVSALLDNVASSVEVQLNKNIVFKTPYDFSIRKKYRISTVKCVV